MRRKLVQNQNRKDILRNLWQSCYHELLELCIIKKSKDKASRDFVLNLKALSDEHVKRTLSRYFNLMNELYSDAFDRWRRMRKELR
jgi:hypothetical protein